MGLLVVLGGFEFAGIGLLVASRAKTLEAVSGLMNLVMIPMWIGSGIFFSPDRFPEMAQPSSGYCRSLPHRIALQRVMLEGLESTAIGTEMGIILVLGRRHIRPRTSSISLGLTPVHPKFPANRWAGPRRWSINFAWTIRHVM
ncbi:MAG: hypothetical protein R3B91_23365 [Planctomycetaceae bacterium]